MNNKKIHILTAPKQSGKTTQLTNWSANRNDVFGILTPVINGQRFFVDAHTKEQFPMEAAEGETAILEVGKYRFSQASFARACAILLSASEQPNGHIIIDEIGPLELRGLGFSEVIKLLLKDDNRCDLIFVIREGLVADVVRYFGLEGVGVMNLEI